MTVLRLGQHPGAEPDQKRHPGAGGRLQIGRPVAHPGLVQVCFGDGHGAGRVAPAGGLVLAPTACEQPVGGPRHGGDGGNPEPLVDRSTLGVVDAGDDALHPEHFASHPGRDDVGVVAGGHCGEGVGAVDPRSQEHVPVKAHAEHRFAGEIRRRAG